MARFHIGITGIQRSHESTHICYIDSETGAHAFCMMMIIVSLLVIFFVHATLWVLCVVRSFANITTRECVGCFALLLCVRMQEIRYYDQVARSRCRYFVSLPSHRRNGFCSRVQCAVVHFESYANAQIRAMLLVDYYIGHSLCSNHTYEPYMRCEYLTYRHTHKSTAFDIPAYYGAVINTTTLNGNRFVWYTYTHDISGELVGFWLCADIAIDCIGNMHIVRTCEHTANT